MRSEISVPAVVVPMMAAQNSTGWYRLADTCAASSTSRMADVMAKPT